MPKQINSRSQKHTSVQSEAVHGFTQIQELCCHTVWSQVWLELCCRIKDCLGGGGPPPWVTHTTRKLHIRPRPLVPVTASAGTNVEI